MASYERHDASSHWKIESWLNSLFGLGKTHLSPALLTLYEGNSVDSLHKGASDAESVFIP